MTVCQVCGGPVEWTVGPDGFRAYDVATVDVNDPYLAEHLPRPRHLTTCPGVPVTGRR